ncbi:metal-dependent hydrolase family protein [Acinetobacter boissieri]|uniref:Imidazolonepropionase n=1 Tax=Acinetobacter boissieri TaxID=1219383 RepID=A0A1G6HLM9_9GAMM|nr:amidohydrolase family protein [Acinetobacter boissieri]SDB95131.1 Imidazolonepropionase [Acinetobacter boissieri]
MPNSIVLKNGNILDVASGIFQSAQDIYIKDEKIVDITSHTTVSKAGYDEIDVTGKTVMPGLIDCHVHVLASEANLGMNALQPNAIVMFRAVPILNAMLMRGFTSVRDAGGADWALARSVALGLVKGPRIFAAGKALSQTGGHGDFRARGSLLQLEPCTCCFRSGAIARVVDGVDNVRLAVREELQQGANQIKIMASGGVTSPTDPIANTQYSEAEICAIVDEATAANTYVMAHAYTPRSIKRAVKCGVRTIEHGNLADQETAELMAKHGVFAVPTQVTYEMLAKYGAEGGIGEESLMKIEDVRESGKRALKYFDDAGVEMGYGSDLLGEMHHYQSHEFLIRAEVLGNLKAVQSATYVAAKILNMENLLGCIKTNAIADILVIDGNPLEDINLLVNSEQSMTYIIKNGQIVKG